jgi:hypothetical protein
MVSKGTDYKDYAFLLCFENKNVLKLGQYEV